MLSRELWAMSASGTAPDQFVPHAEAYLNKVEGPLAVPQTLDIVI
jgi:hypothetical protein